MEITKITSYFQSVNEFKELLDSIPVRKLQTQTDKDFIKKMKKYLKEYGENMTILDSQYKRLMILKEEINGL